MISHCPETQGPFGLNNDIQCSNYFGTCRRVCCALPTSTVCTERVGRCKDSFFGGRGYVPPYKYCSRKSRPVILGNTRRPLPIGVHLLLSASCIISCGLQHICCKWEQVNDKKMTKEHFFCIVNVFSAPRFGEARVYGERASTHVIIMPAYCCSKLPECSAACALLPAR